MNMDVSRTAASALQILLPLSAGNSLQIPAEWGMQSAVDDDQPPAKRARQEPCVQTSPPPSSPTAKENCIQIEGIEGTTFKFPSPVNKKKSATNWRPPLKQLQSQAGHAGDLQPQFDAVN